MGRKRSQKKKKSLEDLIIASFRAGARKTCCKKLSNWLFQVFLPKKFRGKRHVADTDVGRALGFHKGRVGEWRKDGEMSFEGLVILMAQFDLDFRRLPKRPANKFLAVGGYMSGMQLIDERTMGRIGDVGAKEFCYLRSLHRRFSQWKKLIALIQETEGRDKTAADTLEKLIRNAADEAEAFHSEYVAAIQEKAVVESPRDPGIFERLERRWGTALRTCIDTIAGPHPDPHERPYRSWLDMG